MSETELVVRLERLERAHRRLKGFAIAAFVLATALITIYATLPVPNVIAAHEFHVVDDSGKVRIGMSTLKGESIVGVFDAQRNVRALLNVSPSGARIALLDSQGNERAGLRVSPEGESMGLFGAGSGEAGVRATVSASGAPSIQLSDPQGFEMALGNTKTVTPKTGQTQQSSASSIVMSDKERRVIWKAP